ncbi:hypothetical protein L2E82_37526 [Cichorium intybus]|uniref:Uncharacterized protein n=1 Tax=Cichorium intybus TaxID=13427 RepID=A0ACB9AET5_CICIN|nr:hypothetical protein L2E82_37526 [Cichorium intybus]
MKVTRYDGMRHNTSGAWEDKKSQGTTEEGEGSPELMVSTLTEKEIDTSIMAGQIDITTKAIVRNDDKWDSHFAFIRFIKVQDAGVIQKKLSEVKTENLVSKVKMAQFDRR